MSFLRTYVTGNPMLVETRRLYRKFFTLGMGKTDYARTGITAMFGIYVLCLMLLIGSNSHIEPRVVLELECAVLLLLPIVAFNTTIAGERERRS